MTRFIASAAAAAAALSCTPPPGGPAAASEAQVVTSGCDGLPFLAPGGPTTGNTIGKPAQMGSRCGAGGLGPEAVHSFTLEAAARVRLELETPDHDGALYLLEGCGEDGREVACNEDAGGPGRSLVWSNLAPGVYRVVVDGSGSEDAGAWSLAFDVAAGAAPAASTCESAEPLGQAGGEGIIEFTADTFFATDDLEIPCSSSPGGPDVFYAIDLDAESLVSAEAVSSDYSYPVLAMAQGCEGPWQACSTNAVSMRAGPGALILAVDSLGADLLGEVAVSLRIQKASTLEAACAQAPLLEVGAKVKGVSHGPGRFWAGCGDGAAGPEAVYRLDIEERERVLVRLNSPGRDGVLHIRSDCMDPGSEVACNDDHGQRDASEVDVVLEAGAYYVFADAHGSVEAGPFMLEPRLLEPGDGP